MRLIQYSVWKKETNSAGGKAKNDAYDVALEYGFLPSYNPSNKRLIRVLQQLLSMRKFRKADVLLVQYPAIETRLLNVLFRNINPNGISIALIHDLPSIQGMKDGEKEIEISQLKHFSHLIVHNKKMEDYIRNLGYEGNITSLELFDYLHDKKQKTIDDSFSNSISIAGNLKKGKYILDLGSVTTCHFELYGIKGNMDFSGINNVEYKGMLSSDEIIYKLTGDYGLIWDGDSVDSCSGVYGQYLLINNPHKLSMCMAAGKPVITWENAAIADFVKRENIGICVKSLKDLNSIDLIQNYEIYKCNVMKIKNKVADGYYLRKALDTILQDV